MILGVLADDFTGATDVASMLVRAGMHTVQVLGVPEDGLPAADAVVIRTVQAIAAEIGRSMAQVALAWVRQKPGVTAPIIGFSKPEQFSETLAGLDLTLSPDHIARLEAPYTPHAIAGH